MQHSFLLCFAVWGSYQFSKSDLKENGAEPEHIAAVRNDVGAKRFRPEEVVAAVISPSGEWPVRFAAAAALAAQILADLQAARTP